MILQNILKDYIIIKKEEKDDDNDKINENVNETKEETISNLIDPIKFGQYRNFIEHNGSRKKFVKGTGFMYRVFPTITKLKINNQNIE